MQALANIAIWRADNSQYQLISQTGGLAPLVTSEAQTTRHSETKTKFVVSVLETMM